MPRPPRDEQDGAFYHAFTRGNNKLLLYFDSGDFLTFLLFLERVAAKYGWVVHAYCLMPNHYHLVLQIPRGGLSAGMHELNGGYSRRTNARYGRCDHLFRNRFKNNRIVDERQLLDAARYAVLNPVRADICAEPGGGRGVATAPARGSRPRRRSSQSMSCSAASARPVRPAHVTWTSSATLFRRCQARSQKCQEERESRGLELKPGSARAPRRASAPSAPASVLRG